jgi:conjugative relaxase-like TrwC/TraI family protein
VRADEFIELASGYSPLGEVQNAGTHKHRAGWDLTFSAPKSVSVLWGTAAQSNRLKLEQAHDRAVESAFRFMEQHAAFTRRGSGSVFSDYQRKEQVGLVAAVYRHGSSRELDPQLHSHCFVFNVAPRGDGSVGTLDSRHLYEWKMAGGAVYRAELATALRDLGYRIERDETSFRIADVPKALEDEFSKRRHQIEAMLNARGAKGAKASEVAALNSRQSKQLVSRDSLLQAWQETAKEIAPEWQRERIVLQSPTSREVAPFDVKTAQSGMTHGTSTINEAQLYAQVAQERQVHTGLRGVEDAVASLKADRDTVHLTDWKGQSRFTTREMQKIEREMVGRAERMSAKLRHTVSAENLRRALAAKPTLSAEQKRAVEHVTRGGDMACVQGMAGTGKSFMLSAAKNAWESQGLRVRGASLSGKAAQELEKGSGIESTTLKRLEIDTRGYTEPFSSS